MFFLLLFLRCELCKGPTAAAEHVRTWNRRSFLIHRSPAELPQPAGRGVLERSARLLANEQTGPDALGLKSRHRSVLKKDSNSQRESLCVCVTQVPRSQNRQLYECLVSVFAAQTDRMEVEDSQEVDYYSAGGQLDPDQDGVSNGLGLTPDQQHN